MKNEHANRESRLLELTHDAVIAWKLEEGTITYWNAAAQSLYGFTTEEALDQSIHRLLSTEFPMESSAIKDSLRRHGRWEGMTMHTSKSGRQIQSDSRMVCEVAPDDEQIILQTSCETTDQSKTEQALRISEERFRSFIMATAQVVVIADPRGRVVEDSPSWRAFTGQSYGEVEGFGWTSAVNPDDLKDIKKLWTHNLARVTSHKVECRLRRADGQWRWTSIQAIPIRNPDGSLREWMGAITDITEKKRAEEESQVSEERLQYALDAGSMVTWDWNLTTDFTKRMGPSMALFGLADGPGEEFFSRVHPVDRHRLSEAIELASTGVAPLDSEFRVTAADGRTIWIAAKARRRTDPTDGQPYLTGVAMDVTKRQQAKERLKLLDATTEATRTAAHPKAIITRTIALVGEHMESTRCVYGELEENGDQLTILYNWTAEGAPSRTGRYPENLIKPLSADMRAGRTLVVRDADHELVSNEGHKLFEAMGIKAAICCRLQKGEQPVAMIAVHQDTPRNWTEEEVSLVEEIAERFWAHIDRVRARDALQKSEAHLSSLFEQTAVGILETDLSGRIIRANDRYCRILGRSRDEVLGRHMQSFTHPDDRPSDLTLFERAVKSGDAFDIETRYLRPDGTQVWVNNTVSLINRTGDSAVSSVLSIVIDVTQRKYAETKLLETTNRLQFTLEAAEIGDWSLDLINHTASHSLRHDQCFGHTEPIAQWGFEEFIQRVHPDDREYVAQQFRIAVNESESWRLECRIIWPDQSIHWIAVHGSIYRLDGKATKMSGLVFDITKRKGYEQALRESEQRALEAATQAESERRRLDAVLEAVPVGIAVVGVDGAIHQTNPAHRRLWGDSQLATQSSDDYREYKGWWADGSEKHGKCLQAHEWAAARVLRGEKMPRDTVEIESSDPTPVRRVALVSGAPITDGNGDIAGVVIAQMDVTDRVKAEEALREADRRKDEFLAMLAHELRNPLAPIGAAADLLGLSGLDEAKVKQASAIISRQVKHMTGLVDDLLDVSRVTRGLVTLDKVRLNAKQIVSDAVEQVRPMIEARGHRLTIHTPPQAAYVLADQKRLVQVITNLLNNAAKYTPKGGDIILSVEVQNGHVKMTVADNGIGMTTPLVERVFELFAQEERNSDRSQGGLGIGLALVRSLIELHGGTVNAYSDGPGKGSKFTVCLPQLAEHSELSSSTQTETLASVPTRTLKILIVDDNVDAAEMLAMFCEALGHQILIEHTSSKAIERAKVEMPDVCLLDIGLPDMDGNTLARRLRAQPETSEAMLVAVTGYGQEQDKMASMQAGFDHHFVKPLDTARLSYLLTELTEA